MQRAFYIRARPLDQRGGFADFHVPLEYDGDGDGYVCEEYAKFHREEELSCLIVGEQLAQAEGQ